jgi:hypothetical protein
VWAPGCFSFSLHILCLLKQFNFLIDKFGTPQVGLDFLDQSMRLLTSLWKEISQEEQLVLLPTRRSIKSSMRSKQEEYD